MTAIGFPMPLRHALILAICCALAITPAIAQVPPSSYPAATQPLDGLDAVLLDQGTGCAAHVQPCATRQSASIRVGQPVQQSSAPTVPFQFQHWIDTSLSPPKEKIFLGSAWFVIATLDSTNGYLFNVPASAVTGLGTMATQNANGVAITGGTITGMPTPTVSSDVATKSYVDGKASGIVFQQGVKWATAVVLPNTPTYSNGTLGVGATLTAGSNTTLTVDGNVVALNDRVLVKTQADQTQNGAYSLTTAGGGVPWVLTRVTDWDQAAEMQTGSFFLVTNGTVNASSSWVLNTAQPIIVGSSALVFAQAGASQIYTAGTGLTLSGGAFSITNTAVTPGTYGNATAVPTLTINAQGQATNVVNTNIAISAGAIVSSQLGLARGGTANDLSATGPGVLVQTAPGSGVSIVSTTGSGLAVLATSPTLSSPTITSPTISSPTISGATITSPTISSATINSSTINSSTITSPTVSGTLRLSSLGAGGLVTDGSGNVSAKAAPTVTTLTAGSSTYTTPAGVIWLRMRMVGGGGGGGATGGGASAGSQGGVTVFGSFQAAGGAGGGGPGGGGGIGGTSFVGSPDYVVSGSDGAAGNISTSGAGGSGGPSPFGGRGQGSVVNIAGVQASVNSGSGGGGGGASGGTAAAAGGGSGVYMEKVITSPAATFAYTIGTAGAAGSGPANGGTGGSGVIMVEEHYTY